MVWIIGEYGERIDNAGELLTILLENFEEEAVEVLNIHIFFLLKIFFHFAK